MTRDDIAIRISAFLFFARLALWAAWRMLRPRAPQPPEQSDEPEPEDDGYYYRVTPERITTGAFARR